MTTPLFELDAITKQYLLGKRMLVPLPGRTPAVHQALGGVSLSVARGEVLGLVGESGCGKSTLARIMLRLENPTSGRILFDGADITQLAGRDLQPYRRRMQMVFQDSTAALNPRKTIGRMMAESLGLAGVATTVQAERAADLMTQVGLDPGLLRRYPHELSGGQRQRTSIARALAMSPELLVADEPVSSLDVSLQAQIIQLLMELRDRLGLTLIFISHDLALVHHLCSTVAVMQSGLIVEQGLTAQVLHQPEHAYTKRLLDSVPRARRLKAS